MRDEHQVVIDDIGEVVGGQVVGRLVQDLVVENRGVDGYIAADQVVDDHVFTRFDFEPHDILRAFGNESVNLFFRQGQRVAHLQAGRGVVLEIGYIVPFGFQFGRSVECDIGFPGVEQLVDIFAVNLFALRLPIGTVVASVAYPFVEANPQPFEGLDDIGFGSRDEPLGVSILDTEDHLSVILFGKQIIIESGANAAYV